MADSISSPSLCLLVYSSDHVDHDKIGHDPQSPPSDRGDPIGHISGHMTIVMTYVISRGDGLLQTDSQYGYASHMETTLLYPIGDHLPMMSSTVRIRVNPRVRL